MTGIDVQTQTDCRDSESQTSSFHLVVPEPWQTVRPDPWVLAGCSVGFGRRRHLDTKTDTSDSLFARPKAKISFRTVPFVFPTENREHLTLDRRFLEENRLVLEPFASLPFKDLQELEPRIAFKAATGGVLSSPDSVKTEAISLGSNWLARLSRGLNKQVAAEDRSSSIEQSQLSAKSNQRNYAAYLGRHRKILTPRCDPLLVGRMERANAVVLLQKCLRGRAAQITMAETRLRVLELYPELNELDDHPSEPAKCMDAMEELGAIKALVGEQLHKLFTSWQTS